MRAARRLLGLHQGYPAMAAFALGCAALFALAGHGGVLPVLGTLPLLPVTIAAALAGWPLVVALQGRGIGPLRRAPPGLAQPALLLGLGAALAVFPIGIDLVYRFPRDMNVAMPGALAFYVAIALVAEVAFHLLPMALLGMLLPRTAPRRAVLVPAILAEPLFQAVATPALSLQSLLVFGNVLLVSTAQIWLFQRYGFAAMMALRLAFYLFWHILWGSARLGLLF